MTQAMMALERLCEEPLPVISEDEVWEDPESRESQSVLSMLRKIVSFFQVEILAAGPEGDAAPHAAVGEERLLRGAALPFECCH